MLNNQEINELLSVLEIREDIVNVTERHVNIAFRKLALTTHPDKAGDAKTAAFQKLLSAYVRLKKYFYDGNQASSEVVVEENDEECFLALRNFLVNLKLQLMTRAQFVIQCGKFTMLVLTLRSIYIINQRTKKEVK